eukprot:gene54691-4109_t
MTGVIVEDARDEQPFLVRGPNKDQYWYREGQLLLVPDPPATDGNGAEFEAQRSPPPPSRRAPPHARAAAPPAPRDLPLPAVEVWRPRPDAAQRDQQRRRKRAAPRELTPPPPPAPPSAI